MSYPHSNSTGSSYSPYPVLPKAYSNTLASLTYLGAASLAINTLAFVLFYIFKKQRSFPSMILGWVSVLNILKNLSTIIMFAAVPLLQLRGPLDPNCYAYNFFQIFFIFMTVGLGGLLSFMLYCTIVRQKQVSYAENPYYLIGSIVFLILWGGIIPPAAASTGLVQYGFCGTTKLKEGQFYIHLPNLILIGIELVLLSLTYKGMARIMKSASTLSRCGKDDKRLRLMVYRFVPTIISQLLWFLPTFIALGFSAYGTQDPMTSPIVFILAILAQVIDALVLLFTNKPLHRWIKAVISGTSVSSSDATNSDTGSKKAERKPQYSVGVQMTETGANREPASTMSTESV